MGLIQEFEKIYLLGSAAFRNRATTTTGTDEGGMEDIALLSRRWHAVAPSSPLQIPLEHRFPSPALLSTPAVQEEIVQRFRLRTAKESVGELEAKWKGLFLKLMAKSIEEGFALRRAAGHSVDVEDEETAPEIFEALVGYMSTPSNGSRSLRRRYYYGDLSKSNEKTEFIDSIEDGRMISGGMTGLRTWQASIALSNHLLATPSILVPPLSTSNSGAADSSAPPYRNIVELGAGTGLVSLVLGKLLRGSSTSTIIATDVDSTVIDQLQANIDLNGLSASVKTSNLDWELSRDEIIAWELDAFPHGGRADLIFGADIVYDPELAVWLATTLAILLRPRDQSIAIDSSYIPSPVAFVAATIRNQDTWAGFLTACCARRLEVTEVPMNECEGGIVGAEGWEGEGSVVLVRIETKG